MSVSQLSRTKLMKLFGRRDMGDTAVKAASRAAGLTHEAVWAAYSKHASGEEKTNILLSTMATPALASVVAAPKSFDSGRLSKREIALVAQYFGSKRSSAPH